MLTEFGKALRKIRIDKQELLRNMAQTLQVSAAYLSAVENGKRKAPAAWVEQIIRDYDLHTDDAQNLREAYENSQDEVRISLSGISANQRNTALSFAKAIEGLSDEELEKIMRIVHRGDKKE